MSTKIYEAYRIPCANLVDFLSGMRKKVVTEVMPLVLEDLQRNGLTSSKHIRDHIMREVRGCEDDGQGMPYPLDPYDISCGFSVYQKDEYCYLVPYGRALREVSMGNDVVDYSYWNNTDPDENVSEEEWESRGQVWEEILDHGSYGIEYDVLSSTKLKVFNGKSSFLSAAYSLIKDFERQQEEDADS